MAKEKQSILWNIESDHSSLCRPVAIRRKGRRRFYAKNLKRGRSLKGRARPSLPLSGRVPQKEEVIWHVFNARALHQGHIARSLVSNETPKMVYKGNNNTSGIATIDGCECYMRTSQNMAQSGLGKGEKQNSR